MQLYRQGNQRATDGVPVIGPGVGIHDPVSVNLCTADESPSVEGPIEVVPAVDKVWCIVDELCCVGRFVQVSMAKFGVRAEAVSTDGRVHRIVQ